MLARRAVPKNSALALHPVTSSRVPYILPSSVCPKSFVSHSYENCRGVYLSSQFGTLEITYLCSPRSLALRHACGDSSFCWLSTVDCQPLHHESVTNHQSRLLPSLSFQSLTTVKFSKSFVLITIRNAGGGYVPPLDKPFKRHFNSSHFRSRVIYLGAPHTPQVRAGIPRFLLNFQLCTVDCRPPPHPL